MNSHLGEMRRSSRVHLFRGVLEQISPDGWSAQVHFVTQGPRIHCELQE